MYFTPDNNEYYAKEKEFAANNHCIIIELTKSIRKKRGVKRVTNASPIDFINYIAHAQYVITGSFHAMCFSIMLKKEFFVTSSPIKERNGRLVQFLSNIGMENRLLSEKYDINIVENNYNAICKEIEKQRCISLETIERILGEKTS